MHKQGKVYLVGAGPGDPELLTLKGYRLLQTADVIVYDRLANPALLALAAADAELIDVGKAPQRHRRTQDEINAILVDRGRRGKTTVRLKGGDPFVFGRGGEEAQVLAAAGIPFEIVPGISSALAVPAYAGIPVTQRHVSQSFTVVTGHTADAADPFGVNWDDLPREGTLVILMGMRHLSQICQQLIAAGRAADTPAAVIRWGTTTDQFAITATVGTIAEQVQGMQPPAIIVIGDVVRLRQDIKWFDRQLLVDNLPDFLYGSELYECEEAGGTQSRRLEIFPR